MTIEEKAYAYDEAVDKAKVLKECSINKEVVGYMDELFPELKESEDEKIRKELIDYCIKDSCGIRSVNTTCNDFQRWVAWLEKQKYHKVPVKEETGVLKQLLDEQKSAEWSKEDEEMFQTIYEILFKYGYDKARIWLKSLSLKMR